MDKRAMNTILTLAAVAVLVVALLGAYALGGGRAEAEPTAPVRQVTSAGVGTTMGKPDVMRFTAGIDITRTDVDEAVSAANAQMKRVLAKVRDLGVVDKDIRTAQYSIEPRYDYSNNTERLTGYAVTQRARITVRDLSKAGAMITAVSRAGGNDVRVDGIGFEVSDPTELTDRARAEAVKQARAQAEILADAAGATLGKVVTIKETAAVQRDQQRDFAFAARALSAQDAPIEAGQSELKVHVNVTWTLE